MMKRPTKIVACTYLIAIAALTLAPTRASAQPTPTPAPPCGATELIHWFDFADPDYRTVSGAQVTSVTDKRHGLVMAAADPNDAAAIAFGPFDREVLEFDGDGSD